MKEDRFVHMTDYPNMENVGREKTQEAQEKSCEYVFGAQWLACVSPSLPGAG
jgi:hypothetical protein